MKTSEIEDQGLDEYYHIEEGTEFDKLESRRNLVYVLNMSHLKRFILNHFKPTCSKAAIKGDVFTEVKNNLEDPGAAWQYFGSETGVASMFPAS